MLWNGRWFAPCSKMGMLGADGLNSAINKSPLYGRYEDRVDRESAYEKLSSEGFVAHGTQQPIQQEQPAPAGSGGLLGGREVVNEFLFGSTDPRDGKRMASCRLPTRAWRAISAARFCAVCGTPSGAAGESRLKLSIGSGRLNQ